MTQILIIFNDFYLENFNYISFVSSLEFFLITFACEGFVLIIIIYLASRTQKVLDTATKVVTISTGSTVLYNNWVKGDDDDKKDEDKDKNKKDENKDENKEEANKPVDQSTSNEN